MRKIIFVFVSLILSNGQAYAEGCPDFFRFVDFGLETPDGTIRGGPTYRAEGFEGQALLIRELAVCGEVRDVAVDGHGNPIPVVTSVTYDPKMTGVDLTELRLTVVDDMVSEAERNAVEHRARLGRQTTTTRRGPDFLCASLEELGAVSCQFMSPFGGNLALVVYCDGMECRMPVLALNERVIAAATWVPSHASRNNHVSAASEIADKVQQVHDFLAPLSSWTPDFTGLDP